MLSRTELETFQREGYVGPFDLPADLIEPFCGETFAASVIENLTAQVAAGAGPFSDGLRNQHVLSKSLCHLASEPGLVSRLSTILGPDILLWVAHVAPRWPQEQGQQWHIDADNRFVRGIHVSIALCDNTEENGCLQLIPRSHTYRASLTAAGRIGRIDRRDTESVVAYADFVAPYGAPHSVVPVTLRRGQYFLMAEGTWHFVDRNRTSEWRTNILARYARTDVACRNYGYDDSVIELGEQLPCVVVSGQDDFALNRLVPAPTDDLFRLREDARLGSCSRREADS